MKYVFKKCCYIVDIYVEICYNIKKYVNYCNFDGERVMTKDFMMLLLDSNWSVSGSQIILTILSAFLCSLFAVVSAWLTVRRARYNFYSSTVSKERVEWIAKTREITSELVAFCAVHNEDKLSPSDLYEFEKLRSALLLRLSPKTFIEETQKYAETDGVLIKLLEGEYSSVRESKNKIREIVTIICKNEWNRIKAEAGSNKHIEEKIAKYDASISKSLDKASKNNKKKDS
jgi:hypothetical protein